MRRIAIACALVVPLAGIAIERAAIAPLGDSVAKMLVGVAKVAMPTPAPPPPIEASQQTDERHSAAGVPRRTASRTESPRRHTSDEASASLLEKDGGAPPASPGPALDAAPKGAIAIPSSVVTRAIEKRDVSATNATDAAGKPLGARLVGVNRYGTGLHDGDVVISVAGTRTATVDAMVGAAMSAASSGAKRLHGKILRGDSIFTVTIDLPAPPAP